MNLVDLDQLNLAGAAFDHVRARLLKVGGLASRLCSIPQSDLSLLALVDQQTDTGRIMQFDRGAISTSNDSTTWLFNRLHEISKVYGGGVLVVQDLWLSMEDTNSIPAERKTCVFFIDNSPHYWVDCKDLDRLMLEKIIRAPASFQSLYAFSSVELTPIQRSQLKSSELATCKSVIDTALEFYFGAYDQESFLVIDKKV